MTDDFGKNIIEKLQTKGADKSQIWLIDSTVHELNIERNEISFLRTINNKRLSMRIIKDQRVGSSSINDLSEKTVDEAIEAIFETMESSLPDPAHDIAPAITNCPVLTHNRNDATPDLMIKKLQKMLDDVHEKYPAVIIGESHIAFHHDRSRCLNSNGLDIVSENNFFQLSTMITAKDGKKTSSFNGFGQCYNILDPNKDLMDNESFNRLLTQICEQTETHGISDKFTGEIIISPECMGEMCYMMATPLFEHSIIAKTSIYLDKLEQQIATPILTIKTMPISNDFAVKSFIANDGFLNENMTVIDKGVLKTFFLSQYGANKTGFSRSKNQGEMLVVETGNSSFDSMVKSCKRGVLLCRFSGGSPNDNGDFSGVAKNSYYIEDGKIKFPLSETMISGNTADMLKNITEISSEFVNDGYSKLPYVKIGGLTISGGKLSDDDKQPETTLSVI